LCVTHYGLDRNSDSVVFGRLISSARFVFPIPPSYSLSICLVRGWTLDLLYCLYLKTIPSTRSLVVSIRNHLPDPPRPPPPVSRHLSSKNSLQASNAKHPSKKTTMTKTASCRQVHSLLHGHSNDPVKRQSHKNDPFRYRVSSIISTSRASSHYFQL
jgi:hypothetical protein